MALDVLKCLSPTLLSRFARLRRPARYCVLFVLLTSIPLFCQQPQSDPQAVALAGQAISALSGGTSIFDVTLTANVTTIAGSETLSGQGTLLAKGVSESRVDLVLSNSNRSDIRNSVNSPHGAWIGPDGVSHPYAPQNCWTDATWFFPVLSSLAMADPSVVLSYAGLETRAGRSVQHLRSYRYVPAKSAFTTTLIEQQSTVDYYLDANSSFLLAMTFNAYSDDDQGVSFPVEVDFSNYQIVNGAQVPRHIQKLLNGGLVLDIVVTGVALNSGLADQLFAIQ